VAPPVLTLSKTAIRQRRSRRRYHLYAAYGDTVANGRNVTLTDTLPANVSYVPGSATAINTLTGTILPEL